MTTDKRNVFTEVKDPMSLQEELRAKPNVRSYQDLLSEYCDDELTWTATDGTIYKISQIETNYLNNIIAFLERKDVNEKLNKGIVKDWILIFKTERDLRLEKEEEDITLTSLAENECVLLTSCPTRQPGKYNTSFYLHFDKLIPTGTHIYKKQDINCNEVLVVRQHPYLDINSDREKYKTNVRLVSNDQLAYFRGYLQKGDIFIIK
jgi:hypothetical protein